MNYKSYLKIAIFLLVSILLLIGCSSEKTNDTGQLEIISTQPTPTQNESQPSAPSIAEKPPEPVTLQVFMEVAPNDDLLWEEFIAKPISEAYPHITLERTSRAGGADALEQLIAGGYRPDILFSGYFFLPNNINLELIENLEPFI